MAAITIDGKTKHIGSYDDETEAARAYDATVRAQSLDKPLNFPDDLSTAPGVYVPKKKKRVASSRFRGVSLGQEESEVGGAIRIAGKQKPSAATTTRRKQLERTTPRFERRASISRSTFRTISLLHLASTCRRRRSESHRRDFVG